MSDYNSRYHAPSQYDPVTSKSERSFPRGCARSANNNDLSYKDLRNEYSKVISYVDSVRQDRSYQANTRDISTDINSYAVRNNPSADEKYSSIKHKSVLKATTARYLDSEKKIIELEQEVSELKKLLETNYARIATLQRENQAFQDRLKEFKQIDHCNKQLGNEMKSLDHEIVNLTKKMKDLEVENAKLLAEKNSIRPKPTGIKDFQKNLAKYGNYVGHLLSGMEKDHFGRFCFEERFSTEQDFLRLVEARETETLLIQAFRYIGDLLLNVNSANKSVNTSAAISPKKNYDLNETYSSTPAARGGLSSQVNNAYDESRGLRGSYAQSVRLESSKGPKEENSAKLSEADSNYTDDKKQSSSIYQSRLKKELAELHRERANERAHELSAEKVDERAHRTNNESRTGLQRADSRSADRKDSQYRSKEQTPLYIRQDSRHPSDAERLYASRDRTQGDHNEEVVPLRREDSRHTADLEKSHASKGRSQGEQREDRSPYRREDSRHTADLEKSYASKGRSQGGQREDRSPYGREDSRHTADLEKSYASKDKNQRGSKEESRHVARDDYSRKSSQVAERLVASESRPKQSTPPAVVLYEDVISKNKSRPFDIEPQARRAATEVVESHYYEDIPTFSGPSLKMSAAKMFREDSPPGSRKSAHSPQLQQKSSSQVQRPQEHETSSDDLYQSRKSPKSLKASERSTKSRQQQQEVSSHNVKHRESAVNSQVASRATSKKQSEVINQAKPISSGPSPKKESSQVKSSASKSKRPAALMDPADGFIPTKWEVEEDVDSQQYLRSRATPTYSQGRNGEQEYMASHHTDPNSYSRSGPSKQATPKGVTDKSSRTAGQENRSKSPVGSRKSTIVASALEPKLKEARLPSPISKQKSLNSQHSAQVLSHSASQVSQIVYKNQRSMQDSVSPTASNVSLRPENFVPNNQPRNDDRELAQRGSQLIQRENELLQRIRELKQKENELMERERELEKTQPVQKSKDPKKLASPKAKSPSTKTSKTDQRTASPYRDPRSNTNAHRRQSSGEVFTDFIDEAVEPVAQRHVVRQASLSPRSQPDSERQMNIRPILKNSDVRHDNGYYGKHETHNASGFRRERQDTNPEYDGYDNDSRGQRSPYVQTSEDEQRRDQAYYPAKERSAGVESNHRKKLTFGTDTNFDQDLTSIQNESYTSEQRETPPPERKSSPQKADRGTNYPSFKVSFGRTESRFKRSMSPDPKVASIMDVPRKKRVDHNEQTYDVIRGQDYDYTEADVSTMFNNSKDMSQNGAFDVLEGQKSTQDAEIVRASEGRTTN